MTRAALLLTGPALSLILGISLALAHPPSSTPFRIQKTIEVPNGLRPHVLRRSEPTLFCGGSDQQGNRHY